MLNRILKLKQELQAIEKRELELKQAAAKLHAALPNLNLNEENFKAQIKIELDRMRQSAEEAGHLRALSDQAAYDLKQRQRQAQFLRLRRTLPLR